MDRHCVKNAQPQQSQKPRLREWWVLVALFLAMAMATGPGVILVNRPVTILGLPAIYFWGILWYFIIGGLAVFADRRLWRHQLEETETKEEEESDAS